MIPIIPDNVDNIIKNLPYKSIKMLRCVCKELKCFIDESLVYIKKNAELTEYLEFVYFEKRQINRYIKSIGMYREEILEYDIFFQNFQVSIESLQSSLLEFVLFYYIEFNINILNSTYCCFRCNNFNFTDLGDLYCSLCECEIINFHNCRQTIYSNMLKYIFQNTQDIF